MEHDLPGKFIGLLLAFVLCILAPFVALTVESEMLDNRMMVMDITEFIDGVVDSRQLTDSMISELNVKLASYGKTVDYDITRYARSIDADPVNPGDYYVSFIEQADYDFVKGDKICIHAYVTGYSTAETLAHKMSGIFIKDLDVTFTARIR